MAQTMESYFRDSKRKLHIGEPGKWLRTPDGGEKAPCSLCGWVFPSYYNFCPLCGGDMRGIKSL